MSLNNSSSLSFEIYPPYSIDINEYHGLAHVSLTIHRSLNNIDNNDNHLEFEYNNETNDIKIPPWAYEILSLNDYI